MPGSSKIFLKKLKKGLAFSKTTWYYTNVVRWNPVANAPLAQLDRASGYGPEGQEFESLTACQKPEVERLRAFVFSVKISAKKLCKKEK